jgi:hypothetical protein
LLVEAFSEPAGPSMVVVGFAAGLVAASLATGAADVGVAAPDLAADDFAEVGDALEVSLGVAAAAAPDFIPDGDALSDDVAGAALGAVLPGDDRPGALTAWPVLLGAGVVCAFAGVCAVRRTACPNKIIGSTRSRNCGNRRRLIRPGTPRPNWMQVSGHQRTFCLYAGLGARSAET